MLVAFVRFCAEYKKKLPPPKAPSAFALRATADKAAL